MPLKEIRGSISRRLQAARRSFRSRVPSAGSEIPSRGLRRVSRKIQPRRCTPGLLMWPTQSTGSHLLLQKDTAASSDEACTLTECSGQSSNRKRLYQIYRPIQGQRVLWKDLPSVLGEHDSRSTRVSLSLSLSLFIFNTFILLPFLFLICLQLNGRR
jgi:hypothetical protein